MTNKQKAALKKAIRLMEKAANAMDDADCLDGYEKIGVVIKFAEDLLSE